MGTSRLYASLSLCQLTLSLLSFWSCTNVCLANGREEVQAKQLVNNRPIKPKQVLTVLLVSTVLPGHVYSMVNLGEELVKRGHNVTLCTTIMEGSDLLPKVAERVGMNFLSAGYDNLTQQSYESILSRIMQSGFDSNWLSYLKWTSIRIRRKLDSIGVSQFDIIVCDYLAVAVGVYYAIKSQSTKVIIYSPFAPYIPAVIPPWPHTPVSDNLNFLERFAMTFFSPLILHLTKNFSAGISDMDARFNHVLKDIDITSYVGICIPYIITTVVGFEFPRSLTPLTHYVGPVLMGTLPPLHPDIEEWLSEKNERSIIYISMGTTSLLTSDMAKALLGGVLSTDYDAIWALRKSKRDILEGLEIDPDRIHLLDWGAQQTVLAHHAIKLSILHCGLNGVQESLYNAVPIICIPISFDHFDIASKIERARVGVPLYVYPQFQMFLAKKNLTVERVRSTIRQVTSLKELLENASKMRKLFMHAGGAQRAADLVEFYEEVGYDHLIPAYAKHEWTWIQYYNVDVYCLLGTILTLWLYVSYRLIKCCIRICCKCGQRQKTKRD